MRTTRTRLTRLLPLAAALAGCGDGLGPGWIRVPGFVSADGHPLASLSAPSVVGTGVRVPVTVTTFGSGSCTVPSGNETTVERGRVTIRPLDRVAPPGTACTRDLRSFPREVVLRFTETGLVEIVVEGSDGQGGVRQVTATIRVVDVVIQ